MQELFIKYLDNQCSPEEVETLLTYFSESENEFSLRGLMTESLTSLPGTGNESQWEAATDKIFIKIKSHLKRENGRLLPFSRKNWLQIAAAVILLVGAFSIYNSIKSSGTGRQEIAKTDTASHEIGPGGNKAILTLADGTTINLETAANDTLTKQGNTTILKTADGELSYKSLSEKPPQILYNSIATPRGGQYQLTLPDGTNIWLNAASSIHFPVAFTGRERVVEITGEVYFEVAKITSMPFRVKIADRAEVEVLGTHFNINAYEDEPAISTTLLEGSVKITDLTHDGSRTIIPGEQAQLNADKSITVNKQANVDQVIAWKNGIFGFIDADLEMALRQISRWYDVDIIFEGSIPQKKFSGEMQRRLSLQQVVRLLETNNLYCRIEGKKLVVLK